MFPRVATVSYGRVRGRARRYPYWQACLYEYRPRKSDGKLIARLVSTISKPYRSEMKAINVAKTYAADYDIFYDRYVRQNYDVSEEIKDCMDKIKEIYKECTEVNQYELIPLYLEVFSRA